VSTRSQIPSQDSPKFQAEENNTPKQSFNNKVYSTQINWTTASDSTFQPPSPIALFLASNVQRPLGPLVESDVEIPTETLERLAALESVARIATCGPPRLSRSARTMARAMARANVYRFRQTTLFVLFGQRPQNFEYRFAF
jgi:hypothetical protein